ncbi:5-dehydro-2-deoxygluconokinase [Marinomonas epiphytica]
MTNFDFPTDRKLDVVCLGRAGVDLYAQEEMTDLGQVSGFDKFVGGSPANIAVALAKLGAKAGLISCVSDDGLGRFVCDYLRQTGVDLTGVSVDKSGSRTSLAVTEMKPSNCEVVIYRNQAADLLLSIEQVDYEYIADAKILLVSGTALSTSPSREATLAAIRYARQAGTKVVLDVDYRAYSWASAEESSLIYQLAASMSDVVIGNREEFDVLELLGKSHQGQDDDKTAQRFLADATQVLIIKAGELGSKVYTRSGEQFAQGIFNVDVKKPFGAGDSFAGAFMYSLLQGMSLTDCVKMGSAAAAINVSRKSCTEAMPTIQELLDFIVAREAA